ncbi:hypothetical protein [Anaerosporobacter sp.]
MDNNYESGYDDEVYTEENPESFDRRPRPQREGRWISNAIIREITRDRDNFLVTVAHRERQRREEQIIRLVVSRETRIFDVNRRRLRPSELEVGMVIDAFISNAMTRSIPPQARAFEIFVVERRPSRRETVGRIVQVNTRNNYILTISSRNASSIVRFNVGPETVILDMSGRRIRLSDLSAGMRVRVEHATFMTASIPPQTTAFVIQVIR